MVQVGTANKGRKIYQSHDLFKKPLFRDEKIFFCDMKINLKIKFK